jgi:hypothetical protein
VDQRTISNGLFGILVAGGIAMLIAAATANPYQAWLAISGISTIAAGGVGLLWLWVTAKKGTPAMTGDTFNNSGTNFGIMGPVNVGKQEFKLTLDLIRQVVEGCPQGIPVTVVAVGTPRAFPMRDAIAAALGAAGRSVRLDSVMMPLPPPDKPLTVAKSPQHTVVTIAPNV